jgi:hypothetical protein
MGRDQGAQGIGVQEVSKRIKSNVCKRMKTGCVSHLVYRTEVSVLSILHYPDYIVSVRYSKACFHLLYITRSAQVRLP